MLPLSFAPCLTQNAIVVCYCFISGSDTVRGSQVLKEV